MWIFLLLIASCRASLMTYKPQIIDTYDIELFNDNPYFNKTTINETALLYRTILTHPVDVYNLDLVRIKQIHEIDVECPESGICNMDITDREIKYLSLYASMLEVCGTTSISDSYSLGLLRDSMNENVMGQFTKTIRNDDGSLVHMGFWIRLEQYGESVYDEYDPIALTVAMLELAVHERAHYDVTLGNIYAGHCDEYQTQYNSLIRRSVKDMSSYLRLTGHIMGSSDSLAVLLSVIGGVVVIAGAIMVALLCSGDKQNTKIEKSVRV